MRLQLILEKYIPLIGNMLAPAFITTVATFCYLLYGGFSFDTGEIFHWCFYFCCLLSFIILLNFNICRQLFILIVTCLAYIIINYLKSRFDSEFNQSIWFGYLCALFPFNILFFYIYPGRKFMSSQTLIMIMVVLLEYWICELLGKYNINIVYSFYGMNVVAVLGFASLLIYSCINAVRTGSLWDYSVLYSSMSLSLGFYYSSDASGLSMFFFISQLILSVYLIYSLIYRHFYDELSGFFSRNSYLMQSKNFPLKYSLGIISIDNYDKLALTFGVKKQQIITSLIAGVLQEIITEETVFRYAPDQFIVLYKTLDKKEAFNHLEDIRRTIAGASFAWSDKQKPIKLTVSCSVSEKKRSDSGAVEVLMRADKAMRKTLKFSHNVTSQG